MKYNSDFELSRGFSESDDFGRHLLSEIFDMKSQTVQDGSALSPESKLHKESLYTGHLVLVQSVDMSMDGISESIVGPELFPTEEIYVPCAFGRIHKIHGSHGILHVQSSPRRPKNFFDLFQPMNLWSIQVFDPHDNMPKVSIHHMSERQSR